MAYTYDIEDVCFKIIDILGDNMVAKLDTIDTAKTGDSVVLEDIVRYYFGDRMSIPPNQNMPCIIVKGRSFRPEPNSTNAQYRDTIDVEIECYIHQNPNAIITIDNRTYDFGQILDMKIMRYARAIIELLAENEQLGGYATLMRFTNALVSNVIPYKATMIKACRIDVEVLGILNTLG